MPKSLALTENNDSEYFPAQEPNKVIKRSRKSSYANRVFNSSKWSSKENEHFLNFIETYREVLICPEKRKDMRIFLKLSKTMNTRTPDQCRSHHQKMIKYHQNLDGIIQHLKLRLYGITSAAEQPQLLKNMETKNSQNPSNRQLNSFDTSLDLQMNQGNDITESIWEVCSNQIWISKQNLVTEPSNLCLPQF